MSIGLCLDGRAVSSGDADDEMGVRAARIAAAVDLGPRPHPGVQGLVLLDVDEPTVADVTSVGADWASAVAGLVAAQRHRWQLVVDGSVVLDIVDAGDAGLWSVGADTDVTVWRPVGAEELWSALLVAVTERPGA